MNRFVTLGFVIALLVPGSGCNKGATTTGPGGGTATAEAAYKDYIAALNDLAETIEKSESAEAQKAAAGKVQAAMTRLNQMKVTEAEDKKLKDQIGDELKNANVRLGTALTKQKAGGGTPAIDMNSLQAAPKVGP